MRIRILTGVLIVVVLAAGVKLIFFPGGSDSDGGDATRQKIDRLARDGDVEELSTCAGSSNAHEAELAVTALGKIGPTALPTLERALNDARPAVREKAAIFYAKVAVATGDPQKADKLAALVKDDKVPNVRAAAVAGLDRMFAYQQMDAIIDAMEDPDPAVRRRASAAATKFSGVTVQYNPDAPLEECRQGAQRMRLHWQKDKHNVIEFLDSYYRSHYQKSTGTQ